MSKSRYPQLNDRDWLYQKYWIEELSIPKIAKIVGCSDYAVWRALQRFNIPRRNYSEASKGKKAYWYGKHRSEKTKEKISEKRRGKRHSKEVRERMSETRRGKNNPMYGKHHTEGAKDKQSKAKVGKYFGKNNPFFDKHHSEETKQKQREARKHRIFPTHHTKPELIFEAICKRHNLLFKYTGDGSFWIGKGKDAINPDFTHLTKKIVVEIFGWHHDELQRHCKVRYSQTHEGRKKILKKYGWGLVIFWQDDLDREDAEARVLSVLKKHKFI